MKTIFSKNDKRKIANREIHNLKIYIRLFLLFIPYFISLHLHATNLKNYSLNELFLVADSIVSAFAFENETQEIDFFRHFINANTVHLIDNEHTWDTKKILADGLSHFYNGEPKPHVSCGPSALALGTLLNHRKFQGRIVHSFTSKYPELRSHTYLEIYNPFSESWEVQDPDYDICFVLHNQPKVRLSLEDLIKLEIENTTIQTWDKLIPNWHLKKFYHTDSQLIHIYEAGYIPIENIAYINTEKCDLKKIFTNGMTMEQYIKKSNPQVKIIFFP